jgi:hypothetical protein
MATFIKIASVTVGSGGAASIGFTSIPSTYTDLCLKVSARTSESIGFVWDALLLRFNSSASSYSDKALGGNGSSAFSFSDPFSNYIFCGDIPNALVTANTFGSTEIMIPNYPFAIYKSLSIDSVEENNATTSQADLVAGLWSNTAAITSIDLTPAVGPNFVQYTTATLYGISES